MPLDVDKHLYDLAKTRLLARPGLAAVSFRWPGDATYSAQQAVQTEPAALPSFTLNAAGASWSRRPATFGDMLPPSQFDAGQPGRTELIGKLLFDDLSPADQTPIEAEIGAAFHAYGPKFGVLWVGGYTIRKSRTPQRNIETAGVPRWLSTFNITFDVRPRASSLVS